MVIRSFYFLDNTTSQNCKLNFTHLPTNVPEYSTKFHELSRLFHDFAKAILTCAAPLFMTMDFYL